MADIFTFDTSEFELLETIDFEEEIQRPQSMRFFTLDDQLVDFFEKSLPVGKPTTFEKKEIQYAQQRLKTVYNKNIAFSESDYVLDTNRKSVNVPWIHEVYSDFEYKPYSLTKSYVPLLDKSVRTTPNYYPRLLTALPLPYSSSGEGRTLREKKTLVNAEGREPITGLGDYVKTKTVINEDGTYDVQNETVLHTGDDLKIKGFYLETKKFDLPNPLQEHPFLKSTASAFIESDIPLLSMYPTIESIMEHAIPSTKHPYIEGNKFFKYYDVNVSDIPWNTWKQKFPPVETKEAPKYPETIVFPNKPIDEPSEILIKSYSNVRTPGEHPRLWLTNQIDGGAFVGKLLVSASSQHGVISNPPIISPPEADHPIAYSDICTNLTQDFDSFLSSGLYRHTKFDKGIPIEGVCVPVGKIQQEKQKYSDKKIWKESEEHTIKSAYLKMLNVFQKVTKKEVIEKYEKAAHQKESERRKDVLTILSDPQRTPDDKVRAIEMLLRDCRILNNIYVDIDSIFVICNHSMEILRGKMEEDPFNFLREWTSVIEGSRVCKYCNEEVSTEVLVETDEYDEDGYYIESSSKMEVATASTPNSFFQIRSLFDLKHGGESLMFLILSLLQTLPQETQLLPVLHLIRKITASLKARATQKALSQKDQDRVEGVLGLCGTIILLQTHSPFLVPSRFIKLSGYPRDTTDPKDSPILESIIMFMKKTFAGFPVMIEGSMRIIAGDLLARPFKISEEAQRYLPVFASQFNTLLESARERYVLPTEELNSNSIRFPVMKVDNPVFKVADAIGDEMKLECIRSTLMTSYMPKLPPTVRQAPLKLSKILKVDDIVDVGYTENPVPLLKFVKKDVESNISKGMPTGFKDISEFVNSVNDACSFSTVTSRLLDIVSNSKFSKEKLTEFRNSLVFMNSSESAPIMRDSAKGILFKFMNEVKGHPELVRLVNDGIKNDLTLRILLTSKKGAEKEELKLRTQEKNLVKSRYREMNDTEREVVKMLADIGQSEFIVTNIDREIFAKEFERQELEMEDVNRPEEGYDDVRDYVENGDQPLAVDGTILEVDRGNYGDRSVRDYDDYGKTVAFED